MFDALKTGEFRSIYSGVDVLTREAGARMVLPVIVGYPEKIKDNEEAYKEFNRMLTESLRYAAQNKQMVAEAIAKTSNVAPDFLINVLDGIATFKTPIEEDDIKALDYFWNAAKDVGILKSAPSARSIAWKPAMP